MIFTGKYMLRGWGMLAGIACIITIAHAQAPETNAIRKAPSPILTTEGSQEEIVIPASEPVEEAGDEQAAPPGPVKAEPVVEEPVAAPASAAQTAFLVGVQPTDGGTLLDFPWGERTAAALFERGNDIWLIFSHAADAKVSLLRSLLPKSVVRVDQFAYAGATVLRFSTDGTLHGRIAQAPNSYGWQVILGTEIGSATLDIPLAADKDDGGKPYLLLSAFDTSEPLRFYDPVIDDLLLVIPTYEAGRGMGSRKTTPELSILQSPQGIAVASLRDDLTTTRDRNGVKLMRSGGLAVSQNLPVLSADAAPVPGTSATSSVMMPYEQWYVAPQDFMAVRAERMRTLETAGDETKPAAMLAMVQLYLGQGFHGEALGYLSLIAEQYPDFFIEQKLGLLAAAASFMSGRIDEASTAIALPELADVQEAELWRQAIAMVAPPPPPPPGEEAASEAEPASAEKPETPNESAPVEPVTATEPPPAAEAEPKEESDAALPTVTDPDEAVEEEEEEEETDEAEAGEVAVPMIDEPAPRAPLEFDYLGFNQSYIRFYPPRMRQRLAIMAADHYLRTDQPEKAVAAFDTLNSDGILKPVQPYAEFTLGQIAARKDKPKDALKIWDRLAKQQDDRYIQARARFAALMLRYERKMITPQEVIDGLERLRVTWRGDGLEREILTTLADMYRKDKQYDNTLRVMKTLLQGFPGEVDQLTIAGDMTELFEELFLHGLADDMEPLKSLGLFYEFRELTPIGERGDQIIQKLADRLAAVDLLDRATQLLEHQIKFRVSGEERARVGARLGLLYLLNKQPQRAIEIMDISNYGAMPPELRRQRLQLTARALAETGKPEQALSLLFNDASAEGGLLRLDILWSMQDWPNVINAAEEALSSRPNLTEPLSSRETPVLLKLALAYSFENDPTQLRYLRDYYMELIPAGPYKEIFDFLTNDTAPLDPKDFALVARQISRTESFLDNFREKIAAGRLSDVAK